MNCFRFRFVCVLLCFYLGQFISVRLSYFAFSAFPPNQYQCNQLPEMTYYASSGMLNPTHTLTRSADTINAIGQITYLTLHHMHIKAQTNITSASFLYSPPGRDNTQSDRLTDTPMVVSDPTYFCFFTYFCSGLRYSAKEV